MRQYFMTLKSTWNYLVGCHRSPSHFVIIILFTATLNTILSSPLSPGSLPPPVAAAVPLSAKPFTVRALKDWGLTTLKCTKQKVMERLGHGTKTIDSELELQIEVLRDTHAKYQVRNRNLQLLKRHLKAKPRAPTYTRANYS